MSAPRSDELFAEAARLDAHAVHIGEAREEGWALRTRAAALRVSALGERSYPVLVCASCLRLTGWLDRGGNCDACARHAARLAAEARSWLPPPALPYPHPSPAPALPLGVRIAARLGRARPLDMALTGHWLAHVEPGVTGPVEPEPGFELEVASRDELERVDALGILVRFASATHRFAPGGWERLASTRIGRSAVPNPAEFAAELPIETLIDAWFDYQEALSGFNRRAWSAASAAREAVAAASDARAQALAEQEHTSELLQE